MAGTYRTPIHEGVYGRCFYPPRSIRQWGRRRGFSFHCFYRYISPRDTTMAWGAGLLRTTGYCMPLQPGANGACPSKMARSASGYELQRSKSPRWAPSTIALALADRGDVGLFAGEAKRMSYWQCAGFLSVMFLLPPKCKTRTFAIFVSILAAFNIYGIFYGPFRHMINDLQKAQSRAVFRSSFCSCIWFSITTTIPLVLTILTLPYRVDIAL